MKEYDAIIIGSGAGALIVENALMQNMNVALVDKGPLGGTCLNLGCIPSKMLIYPADRIVEIKQAKKLGIDAEIKRIDFRAIMKRMRKKVQQGESHIREAIKHMAGMDYYEAEAHFVDDYTLDVKGEKIKGRKIFIAAGARPFISPIKGLDKINYLTNESVLELEQKPESMIIIGGGYIAAEYGHFFSTTGTSVTIIQRNERLLPEEEPEISALLLEEMRERMEIHTSTEAVGIMRDDKTMTVTAKYRDSNVEKTFSAEEVMIVTGRKSNADLLKVGETGVETDERGYIKVNDYLETSKENIWAFGDVIGKEMFRHVANREAAIAWRNSEHKEKVKMDYHACPHAVFTYPEIASVGLIEAQALEIYDKKELLVGRANYSDVAMGEAMMDEKGFAKAIVERKTGKILGFHIIGPYSSVLVQEVINLMANESDIFSLNKGMHIHPALPELIISTLGNLREL